MVEVEFEYKDKYTNGNWSRQSCVVENVAECIKWYGLGVDCEYRIVKVTEVK